MEIYTDTGGVPYTRKQMFDLIADVERYPDFLPGWLATRIIERDADTAIVEQEIGSGLFRTRFSTRVVFTPPGGIDIASTDSPFRRLTIRWRFEPAGRSRCLLGFYAGVELRSALYERLAGPLLKSHFRCIASAFENRANQLYGPEGKTSGIAAGRVLPGNTHPLTQT